MDELKAHHQTQLTQQKERILTLEKDLSLARSKWALAEQLRCQLD